MTKELENIDHDSNSQSKYLSQYKKGESVKYDDNGNPVYFEVNNRVEALISSFVKILNDLEDQFSLFKSTLDLESAEGANLDLLGDMLNAPAKTGTDAEYRNILKSLIIAYNSDGTAQDIKNIIDQITDFNEIRILDGVNASFSIWIDGALPDTDWRSILSAIYIAKSAGVEFGGITAVNPNYSPYFGFDNDPSNAGTFLVGRQGQISITIPWTFPISGRTGNVNPEDLGYVFAADGEIASAARIGEFIVSNLSFVISTTYWNDFYFALNNAITSGNILKVTDKNGVVWEFDLNGLTLNISGSGNYRSADLVLTNGTTIYKDGVVVPRTTYSSDFPNYLSSDQAIYNTNNPNGVVAFTYDQDCITGTNYQAEEYIEQTTYAFEPQSGTPSNSPIFQGFLVADQNSVIFAADPNASLAVNDAWYNQWLQNHVNVTGNIFGIVDASGATWIWEKTSGASSGFFRSPSSGAASYGVQYYWDYVVGTYNITRNGVPKSNIDVSNEFADYGTTASDVIALRSNNNGTSSINTYYISDFSTEVNSSINIDVRDEDQAAFQSGLDSVPLGSGMQFTDNGSNLWVLAGIDNSTPIDYTAVDNENGTFTYKIHGTANDTTWRNRFYRNDTLITDPLAALGFVDYASTTAGQSTFDTNNPNGLVYLGDTVILPPEGEEPNNANAGYYTLLRK